MVATNKTVSVSGGDAGLNLTRSGVNNPNPILHGGMGQAERAFSAASTFLSGVLAISASQFIGAPLKLVDPKFYDAYMAWTKESFAILMTTMTQWWAPTVVRVSGDESMKGQLYLMDDGTLKCNFPHRLILMANHQLYTDWLYLWWIAYTNKMHGRVYIILKESLKNLPIVGWGAQFYNFIFLSRKWETDQWRFRKAFSHLKDPNDPMWLLIFPEGTNLSAVTREKSASWAKKTGIPDMKNQLLPRSTGLKFCLQELGSSTNWLYDCTVAYEGVPKGQYGQDIFTLKSSFFEGRPPKSVNLFWRRFRISEIPIDNDEAFSRWLTNRWREKDYILEYFFKFGNFPADDAVKALAAVEGKRKPNHAKMISTEVKGGGWDEFLSIFGPVTTAAGALSGVDFTEALNFDAILGKVMQQQDLNLLELGKGLDPSKLMALGKNLDPSTLMKLGKNLDPDTLMKLSKGDPSTLMKLSKGLDPSVLMKLGKDLDPSTLMKLSKGLDPSAIMKMLGMGRSSLPATSQEAIRKALEAANKQKPLPKPVIDKLLKEAPQTQEGMKKALLQSGNAEIARKVSRAPAAKAAVSPATKRDVAQAARTSRRAIINTAAAATPPSPRANGIKNPAPLVKQAMPMANMEAMITRPLSTMAVQTAAATVKNTLTQRPRQRSVQQTSVRAKTAAAGGRRAVSGGVTAKRAGAAPTAVPARLRRASLTSTNLRRNNVANGVGSVQTVGSTIGTKKTATVGSKPLGAQKYANGKVG